MPQLQLHMLRVAGVAKIITDSIEIKLDKKSVIIAMLLHDMGNMTKIKLDRFPEFTQPQGIDYWENIQKEFIEKYGESDYAATYKILEELNIDMKVQNLIRSIEFAKMGEISLNNNFEQKICIYSDARVAPNGVTSLEERLTEVKERYIKNKGVTEQFFQNLSNSARDVEAQIFSKCTIKPKDIAEIKVEKLFDELLALEI